jgi:glutathione S-transferase
LREEILGTGEGRSLKAAEEDRDVGIAAHTDAKVRYFGESRDKPRVTLYRDQAAWCPYCQKVWLLLEAKEVDYTISKVPMRSYGDKPDSFMARVPRGLLPAIEIDGRLMTESLDIMFRIESVFFDKQRPMFPPGGPEREHAVKLLELERAVFGAWCGYLFRPEMPFIGSNSSDFESALRQMELELGRNMDSPWFLPYDHPTIVDMQYVSHMERTVASAMYYKGYDVRDRFRNIDRWLAAFEDLPYYMATKSDYYTHCMDIPPQYGPPFPSDDAEAKRARLMLNPSNSRLPLDWRQDPEPRTDLERDTPQLMFKIEAAWALARNHEAIVKFACRPAGEGVGDWAMGNPYKAELSDPYAAPGSEMLEVVSGLLRLVACELLRGPPVLEDESIISFTTAVKQTTMAAGCTTGSKLAQVAVCLEYLRDRIGVPRDLSMPAAKILRAHLGEAAITLRAAAAQSS